MKRLLSFLLSLVLGLSLFINIFSVGAALVGDIDGDGEVTKKDATIAMDIASGRIKGTSAQKTDCDLNKDGKITTDDVRLILQRIPAQGLMDEETFAAYVKNLGFPLSYADSLFELHQKYPLWEFKPFITNLEWADAVAGEHTPHKKQLIENSVTSIWECQCSSCKGKIQEGSSWVSASEQAVEYYLDPRNFLTEQYIFQFETTRYDEAHTQSSVEAILKNTWMYNSNITYYDTLGKEKTYTIDGQPVKYSEAIMKAAEDSGMSAYYLASKIVQEVGGASASAGGASGKYAPYNGIYNYYNIGAYTGVADGLKWANGYMKTTAAANIYKTASTSAEVVVNVASGQTLNYIGASGSFYRVSYTLNSTKHTGYVPKASVSLTTSYGRPWTNPYKSIYNGAQYIYNGYATYQYTGYLQKFNVNSASGNLYGHEYMANIRAAASEAKKTYNAYKENGVLSDAMVFYIPVFKNMPGHNLRGDERFKARKQTLISSSVGKTSVTLDFSKIEEATGYQVYKYDDSQSKYVKLANTTSLTYKDTTLKEGTKYNYKVRAYQKQSDGTYIYSKYTDVLSFTTPKTATTTSTDTAYSATGVVNISSGSLNIRKSASTSADVVYSATNGQAVTITAKNGEWYKVTLAVGDSKYTGYAHSDYITVNKPQGEAPAKETCPYAEPTATLRNGSSGEGVKWLQWHLWKLGYLASKSDVDGAFGSGTETAVKKFQTDSKLDVDGLVGSGTRGALKEKI